MADPFTVGTWGGLPNYTCTACPRADLNKNRLLLKMASVCGNRNCPGKPRLTEPVSKIVTVPLLDAKGTPITRRNLTDKETQAHKERKSQAPPL